MKPTTEWTTAGEQYVLPGAERRQQPQRSTYTVEDDQLVIPGGERISNAELVARLAARPIIPRRPQRGLAGTALFGAKTR